MKEIIKICPKHGELTAEQIRMDGNIIRCTACRVESNKRTYYKHREKRVATSMKWKQQNRGDYNEWCRQDRKNNPEKYRMYEANKVKKHGIEKIRKIEVARIHGLKVEEYETLLLSQNNVCAICNKPETRLGRDGKTITPLCVDHCHHCEEESKQHIIRGLLCRACNSALGLVKDDVEILRSMIKHLENHVHIVKTEYSPTPDKGI